MRLRAWDLAHDRLRSEYQFFQLREAGLLPTCPHPRPGGIPNHEICIAHPHVPISFLFLVPSHDFLTLLPTLNGKSGVSPQHHPPRCLWYPWLPRKSGGRCGGGAHLPSPALLPAALTCRMEVRCSFLCTLEASRLNSRAMRPRCVKSWLRSGSSAHTLSVVSSRCRCSIRLLSSWGGGPKAWREGRAHGPLVTAILPRLPRARDSVSP